MADHVLELVGVTHRRDTGRRIHLYRRILFRLGHADAAYDPFETHRARVLDRRRPGPQLQHQLVHSLDDVDDREQHVALKLRVVAVAFCIPQQQRQLRHQVLQIVHYKRRHAIERIELAHLEQCFGRLNLAQVTRRLASRSFQQVEHFPIHLDRSARGDEDDEPHEAGG